MQIPIIIALVTLGCGIIFRNIVNEKNHYNQNVIISDATSSQKPMPTSTATPLPIPTITPSIRPSITKQIIPSDKPSQNHSEWIYPSAAIIKNEQSSILLSSTDNPDSITEWYKNQITSRKLAVTTFVKTNSNGNINNVLAGNGNLSIKVEITKKSTDQFVLINVSL
jgi:hypothetical protein